MQTKYKMLTIEILNIYLDTKKCIKNKHVQM